MEVHLQANVLGANDAIAHELADEFAARGIFCINLISSPGAGKTTLLEKTCELLAGRLRLAIVEGDITTSIDADRIAKHGVPVHQVNTFGGCHLDAKQVQKALHSFDLDQLDLLIIENVGNLVCPADFQLGEDIKVVVLSVPEGDDKPSKYPGTFQKARVLLINKMDIAPYVNFDMSKVRQELGEISPGLHIFETVGTTGEGVDAWCDWLVGQAQAKREAARR